MFSKPEEVARFANSVCDNDAPRSRRRICQKQIAIPDWGVGYRVARSRYWYCADHDEGTETAETILSGKPFLEL